jgi:alkylation response protein AidB-like acyl-CoA dehydrogenase
MSDQLAVAKSFSEPQAIAFRSNVREWLIANIPGEWLRMTESMDSPAAVDIRRDWDRTLASSGYAGLTWPRDYAGSGAGPIEEAIFYEECALAGAPEGLGRIGRILAGPIIIEYGNHAQKSRYLKPILDGAEIWCEGLSEPDAGSDLASLATAADYQGDHYVLNGGKIWTTYAHFSDLCLLLAKTAKNGHRHHNLSIFALDMRSPGITITPIRQITGTEGFNQVFFSDVCVPVASRIGMENAGWEMVQFGLRSRTPSNALIPYLELSRIHTQLEQCAAELHVQPTPALELVATELNILRWHILRCVEAVAQMRPASSESSVTRLLLSELEQRTARLGLDLGCPTHEQYWRYIYLRSRAKTIAGGTSEIQRNMIANHVLGLPRD